MLKLGGGFVTSLAFLLVNATHKNTNIFKHNNKNVYNLTTKESMGMLKPKNNQKQNNNSKKYMLNILEINTWKVFSTYLINFVSLLQTLDVTPSHR